ncbi:MAG: hypothetical protein LQ345_001673 [Seirophora villosa]|nr:MAG: hypothetical protein LQ345_001673 [Seirophora villosa]
MFKAKSKSNSSSLNGSAHPELAVPSSPLQHVPVREGDHVPANTSSTEWWKIRLFEGMANDIRRRAPFYWSDWKDAWDYRVVPATVYIWSLVMHWVLAITNACNALTYVTRFSCDIFGFYVAFIYLQKGIQVLTRQWASGEAGAYLSITVALLVLMVAYLCGVIGGSSLFQRYVRKFIEDYGTPLTIIFFTGFVHIGRMANVELETLPTSRAFFPTQDRGWLIRFWETDVGDVFLAIPFAVLLTVLFYFDHNVSSLIAQGTEFPLRKPAGFHWDIFLLGLTTGVGEGLLGIPFPNGLIPQAPFHTNALCVTRQVSNESETGDAKGHTTRVVDHVVEQRVSNLAQGILTLGTMTGPLLIVLHLIPNGVLAGLFFVMGVQALEGNGITLKMVYLAKDRSLTGASDPLSRMQRKQAVWYFVALELLGFGATFAITQTIAAIGFPVFILLLIPVRTFLLPKYFTSQELSILDAPTASPFTMESVGGNFGEDVDALRRSTGMDRLDASDRLDVQDSTERGEAKSLHRRYSRRSGGNGVDGDNIELQPQPTEGLSNRSRSRASRS